MLKEHTDTVCKLLKEIPLGELYSDKYNFREEYNKWLKTLHNAN